MGGYSISLQGQKIFEHTSAFLHKANNVSCCILCCNQFICIWKFTEGHWSVLSKSCLSDYM
jgi:hypothetical protein